MGWRRAQNDVEKRLHDFLGLDDEACVIYVNRAANAMHMALHWELNKDNEANVFIEEPTFHAAWRVVERVVPCLIFNDSSVEYDMCIPRTLGGEAIDREWFGYGTPLVYDCAQSCYWSMFEGVEFDTDQYAVLSFQESKPRGSAAGGGALILNKYFEGEFRELYVPGRWYYNPRTGQCNETVKSIRCRDHEGLAKTRLSNFLMEQHLLEKRGLKVLNANFDEKGFALFTHVYVQTPQSEEMRKELGDIGYRFYADNKLMRKEIVG